MSEDDDFPGSTSKELLHKFYDQGQLGQGVLVASIRELAPPFTAKPM